jgi:hypothetical protein
VPLVAAIPDQVVRAAARAATAVQAIPDAVGRT